MSPASAPDQASIAPRRILVVEDNHINQIVVEGMLKRDGHAVTLAADGAEAVAAVAAGDFDLVLMDMQMPVLDGLAATRAIRALPGSSRGVPIVALTANASGSDVERCRTAGMNDHLAKPLDRERLRQTVAIWGAGAASCAGRTATAPATVAAIAAPIEWIDTPTLGLASLLDIFDGDHAGVDELIDAALASVDVDQRRIAESAAANDRETLISASHRLKGTSGSIRSAKVLAISTAIERAAKDGAPRVEPGLLRDLHTAIAELHAEVTTGRARRQTAVGQAGLTEATG